ncbi:unnamed protein product [Cochlearia groenlandica]
MENVAVKSLNLSEIISRLAKVCKFRSTGVFPDQKSCSNDSCWDEIVDILQDKATETVTCSVDYKPTRKIRTFRCDDEEISKLFGIVSALKLAYLEFQQAHFPYDPDKIIEADNLIVSQLEALRRIKRLYLKTKQLNAKNELDASTSCLNRLRDEINVSEKHLETLKAQVKAKEIEIHSMKKKLDCLVIENTKLEDSIVNVSSFEFVYRAASKSVHDFAKPLITLMKATDWDMNRAVESIVGNVRYGKNSDKKYAFESYIVRRMFHGVKFKPFDDVVKELMSFDDPLDLLTAFPDSEFSRFCGEKYLLVVHPSMESSFFGNLDMRALVLLGKHPRTVFYRIFAKMAKWVWVLGSFAATLDLKAKIFVVRRGTRFSSVYMETLVVCDENEEKKGDSSVEFMAMPGFKIGDSVIKSQVYLSKTKG